MEGVLKSQQFPRWQFSHVSTRLYTRLQARGIDARTHARTQRYVHAYSSPLLVGTLKIVLSHVLKFFLGFQIPIKAIYANTRPSPTLETKAVLLSLPNRSRSSYTGTKPPLAQAAPPFAAFWKESLAFQSEAVPRFSSRTHIPGFPFAFTQLHPQEFYPPTGCTMRLWNAGIYGQLV